MNTMWKTQQAAVTGSGHRRKGTPCQDRTHTLTEQGVTAIALADGAGSARLSQEGAEAAVERVCQVMCRQFDRLFEAKNPLIFRQLILNEVLEAVSARAEALGAARRELACTLLAVAVRGDDYLLFHLGDGVIACRSAGRLKAASLPDNGEFVNTTAFVTSRDALLRCRVMKGTQPALEGFCLMSDGCEAALYDKRRRRMAPMVEHQLQRLQLMDRDTADRVLELMLRDMVARRTEDDCSLALMTRRNAGFGDWARMTQREQALLLGVETHDRNRRRRQIRRYARACGVIPA